MRNLLVVVVAVGAFVAGVLSYVSHRNAGTARSAVEEGWVSLFDGHTIDQWRGFKMPGVPDGWKVVDQAMTRAGEGGDLISEEEYGSFEFTFEWKVPPGGNSGVMFHVTEDAEKTYHTGPEFQILDNARHADGKNPLTSAGAAYALYAPSRDATRPVGEWNEGRLLVNGAHVEHWLNGEKVVEYEQWTPEWSALVSASKFSQWPGFGLARTGHLALQDHGDAVAFRNLRVRRLQ